MKFIKWRILIITSIVCLLPILLGVALWSRLPQEMAIHFDFYNNPDNYASKEFTVFFLPVMMAFLQLVCCIINDINAKKHGERKKFEKAAKWIIPVISVVLQIIVLGYSLGWNIDIRKAAMVIVGGEFLVLGNYLPKLDYIKNYDLAPEKARKINRFVGFETVILGLLFIISAFLPPISSICCLLLIIPHTIIGVVYGVVVGRK